MNQTYKAITISEKEYKKLLESRNKLTALESAGVDNWEGYDDAMEDFERYFKDND